MNIRVKAFTMGENAPSARFRVRQLTVPLRELNVVLDEDFKQRRFYVDNPAKGRVLNASLDLLRRLPVVANHSNFDAAIFQKPIVTQFMTLERFWRKPLIFDVDDAVHLRRNDGGASASIARIADVVIVGNSFLAEYYDSIARRVEVIPTSIDCHRFINDGRRRARDQIIIGWIGTRNNLKYIENIDLALAKVAKKYSNVMLHVVSDSVPQFREFPSSQLKVIPWSETTEIDSLSQIDIGIMPLEDGAWERGKCSFKMLQYMAMRTPVVVSPVGMNAELLAKSDIGFCARSSHDWMLALESLISDPALREKFGLAGRILVEKEYSTEIVSARLKEVIASVL